MRPFQNNAVVKFCGRNNRHKDDRENLPEVWEGLPGDGNTWSEKLGRAEHGGPNPSVSLLGRQRPRQAALCETEDSLEFQASLGYVVRPHLNKETKGFLTEGQSLHMTLKTGI